jgi:hypothetical protein
MNKLQIRQIYRYSRPYSVYPLYKDEYPNHFAATETPDHTKVILESGINPIAKIKVSEGHRLPAIVIRSSPHKIGSESTPWQDIFDVDNGHIRYYGDNKTPGKDPATSSGNKILLEAFETYNNPEKRHLSVPLIFYKAVSRNKSAKGYIEFNGFGIIKGVELITQFDRTMNQTFSNYVYNFHVFSLATDHEEFNWDWISARRDRNLSLQETLQDSPVSWKEWIKNGHKSLEKIRRRVSKLHTVTKAEQVPQAGSKEEKILIEIYKYYNNRKSRFEGLASTVASRIFSENGGKYKEGWITPSSSDGGADFYGRLDLGSGFGKAKLIVLGQAKCESLNSPTGGNHIARTVARLKRGWVGVYVTTSFFSEAVQREVIEDEYPIMLVNGLILVNTIMEIMHEDGYNNVSKYLDFLDDKYEGLVQVRRADELLFE